MLNCVQRILALVVGTVIVIIGVAGLFLPILQGFLLIVVGLSLMSLASDRVGAMLDRWKRRLRARLGGSGETS